MERWKLVAGVTSVVVLLGLSAWGNYEQRASLERLARIKPAPAPGLSPAPLPTAPAAPEPPEDEWSEADRSPSLSSDGSFVVYSVERDIYSRIHVMRRSLRTGRAVVASRTRAGTLPLGRCGNATVSNGGRWIAFDCDADHVVPGDDDGMRDVFVIDMRSMITRLVSRGEGGFSRRPKISADGRYVAFESTTRLVREDLDELMDVYRYEMPTGKIVRVTRPHGGSVVDGNSEIGSMSADGKVISFISSASNLVAGDTNGAVDAFIWRASSDEVRRVSEARSGAELLGSTVAVALSPDATHVAFVTYANLRTGAATEQVVLAVRRSSVDAPPVARACASCNPGQVEDAAIADAARVVAVTASDVGYTSVFVNGRAVGTSNGGRVSMSQDGRRIAFYEHGCGNLLDGDSCFRIIDPRTGRTISFWR